MPTINFPLSPAFDDTYTFGGKTWVYNGTGWALTASGDISPGQVDAFLTLLGASATGKALFASATAAAAKSIVEGLTPAFGANKTSNQTITASTYTKVTYPIEEYDKTANYDTANSRFTPNVAGVYSITASIGLDTSVDTTRAILAIYKNGANHKKLFDITASMPRAIAGAANVYLNGTTDYIEVWTWVAATTASVDGSVASSFQSVLAVPD